MRKLQVLASIAFITPLLFAIPLTNTGCTTTTQADGTVVTKLDPTRTSDAIRAILPAGVVAAVNADHNSAAYLQASALAINAAVENGAYDPDKLKATLDTISVKELRTPEARVCIEAALGIYRAYWADSVSAKLDQTVWVKPVMKAIADGIEAGLAGT